MSRSLDLLTRLVLRETGADGYSISAAGAVEFNLDGGTVSEETQALLKRFARLIELVSRREQAIKAYARQAARIGEMETELTDAKIAARASGLLVEGARDGDLIGAIENHVEGVLRPSEFGTILEKMSRELEEEIAERKLTAQAKAFLQSSYNMSEEQAHLHLRTISRKSRRPLRDVARELIEARNSLWLNPL